MSSLPWLCYGDFNEILTDSEKLDGLPRPRFMMENFREVLDFCELEDMGYSGPEFT